ncbi:MAG: PKD domain-containing protein, partial [Candidatus Caldatribacteriota bacterium]|nr:PKD domain-containing protein [Candidatus Caldatribacteriota bacterium]
PNAGTTYEVWDNTEVKVKFRTEYGTSFGENLSVNFEKGEVLATNDRNLEYTWHTPTIVSGSQDTAKITVSYGPVSQEFIITIKDHLPMASFAFNPSSPQTGQRVHFDASDSTDIDGEISSYHWSFVDEVGEGDETVVYEQVCIDHTFFTAGDYIVTLVVTDNNSQTTQISQNIKVTAAPKPPVADFKLLDPSPQWDTKVRFDASLSSDPDGSIASYQWDFGDGTTGEGINVSHEYSQVGGFYSGVYDVILTVTNNQNLSTIKKIPIIVGHILSYENKGEVGIPAALRDLNELKVNYQIEIATGDVSEAGTDSFIYLALFGPEKKNGRYGSGELHLYDALDCYGPFERGKTDSFTNKGYNLEDIEFITLRHNNSYDKPGWYVKEIKVKNVDNGNVWLFVPDQWLAMDKLPEHQTWGKFVPVEPPVAKFIHSPTNPFIGELVSFDSSGSSDPNGTIVSYDWDFGDGTSPGAGVISSHQFQEEGVHTVTLTVTDDESLSNTITESFIVKKNLIGNIEAIIEWAWDSPVDISFPEFSEDSINSLQSNTGTTLHFHVDWKIKDNSRTIGYPLYVASELKSYDFSTWDWVAGETEGHKKTGKNTRWGKYNKLGTWSLNPLQPNPITKYKLTLTGKSYDESKEKSEEFYASLPITNPNISSAVRTAAPNWIAGRYELALIFRAMSQHWKNIKNSSLSEENYRKETERILGSTYCLFGSTTARGCATNLGLDFLEVAANVASSALLSGAVAVTGPLNMAITYTTWAKDNLSWSAEHWDDIFSADSIWHATHTTTENDWESSLEKSLNELFPAILEEADESMNFIYSNGLVNDWYTKLQNENTKLGKVAEKALVAYNNAETIFIANGTSDAEKDVLEFLEFIIKMANSQTGILD